MTKKNLLKGVILVGTGAITYGMLATFVKMAYTEGYTTAEITISQFVLGILGMLIINAIQKTKKGNTVVNASRKNIFSLMLAGTSLGLTSIFYYLTVKFIPVSIAIVLLMQTVWIGVFLEMILDKKRPSFKKSIAVVVVLVGTVLATNILETKIQLDWRGIILGLLSAASFATTMFTANRVALIISFAFFTQTTPFNFSIFIKWGILLALFGTIIPPLLMNAGFPYTGIGLGSIVAALELPVSVLMAYFILNEPVNSLQWLGIVLIILAVILMNITPKKN
jgi:drug/metabolite transporter (DMT)-like permease